MKKILSLALSFTILLVVNGQSKNGKENIEKLCGCYDVVFKYAETFSPDESYKFHDREEINGGTELIIPIETGDRKIVLQHLLVVSDSMIIKHWREDWTYEDPIIWKYDGNKIWKKQELKPSDIKGRWTQSVWEVSDAPRYQGISEWVRTDGQLFWQNTTDAPLPRREYKVRKDYNILRRTNRIILNDSGWVHEQDNQKIIRNNGVDKLLVEEKGINSYRKIDDKHCAAAKQFWERNKNYWAHVRNIWNEYAGEHSLIELQTRVDGKVLHEYLDELLDQFSKGEVKEDALNEKIKILLSKFLSMHS